MVRKMNEGNMRVAVVGGGISGVAAAYELSRAGVEVVLYEKEEYLLGGRAKTLHIDGVGLDLGFLAFNQVTCPTMMELLQNLVLDMESSDTSFSVSLNNGQGYEWGTRNGLRSLFAQKSNAGSPYFWKIIWEIREFKHDAIMFLNEFENNPDTDHMETLGHFIKSRGYSELFQKSYLVPMCASIWSCPSHTVMNFSAFSVLSFCHRHHLFELFGSPQWLTPKGGSCSFVNKIREELKVRGNKVKINCEVQSVSTSDEGCMLSFADGSQEIYDRCIIAVNAPDAVRLLGDGAKYDEKRILGSFQHVQRDVFLHRDKKFMPQTQAAWSAWNCLGSSDGKGCLTYWLNVPQKICNADHPFLLTHDPPHQPENVLLKWSTAHLIPSVAATKASLELSGIQGVRGLWFCGAYQGYGLHSDELKAGMIAAQRQSLLGKSVGHVPNPKQMMPTFGEAAARLFVTRFLKRFITAGCLILIEDGGSVLNFKGSNTICNLTVTVRVHKPQFYWKIATEADMGLADAYINGDFSFPDKNEGLLNLFTIFMVNRDSKSALSIANKKRGWWTPMFTTAGIASAKYFYRHFCRRNTVTQARENISRHYDLSNKMFSLFLDDTMSYSCAIFESEKEELEVAQLRKIHLLIEKARVEKHHEVLEIGCGWGGLAVEVVKRTGCRYTGITLSEEQLKFAEQKAKEAGLQDRIRFLLCDYRQVQDTHKYDRIISCEMLEAVGDEYMEEFFRCCDRMLAANGVLVLQFTSIPDDRYEEYRRSSCFIKEYIFPGVCAPSLSRVTSAMAAASKLWVEQVENIGITHYFETLRRWRSKFLQNQSEISSLGFDDKFIRTWEYYFDYAATGFKTHNLGNYLMVLSRPCYLSTLG